TGEHIPAISDEERHHRRDDSCQDKFRFPPFFCLCDKLLPFVNRNPDAALFRLTLAIDGTNVAKLLHALWANRLAANITGVGGRFLPVFRAELDGGGFGGRRRCGLCDRAERRRRLWCR